MTTEAGSSNDVPRAALDLRARLLGAMGPEMTALRRLHAGRRLAEVGTFLALWGAGAWLALAGLGIWAIVVGIALSGVALNALMLLTHEGHHGLLARTPWLNRVATVLLAIPLLHSPSAYRALHTRHHRHLGEDGDPDDYENYAKTTRGLWAMHWMRLTVGPILYIFAIPAVAWRVSGRPDRRRIVGDYAFLLAVYATLAWLVPWQALVLAWLAPLLPVGYFTALRGLAQHGLTDRKDPHLAARTFRANRLVAFCLLHENLHLEHHLFPEVPSYHLPRLHALVWPHLPRAIVGRSYLGFLVAFMRRSVHMDGSPLGVTRIGGAG